MKKSVLIVGGGGREHSIAWKLRQSPDLGRLFVAPGNAGTQEIAENVPVKATDIKELLTFAQKEQIDLTVVGQDDPLALGIVDSFQGNGLRIFGPTQAAAQIESSKVLSKQLMVSTGVPTAPFVIFDKPPDARAFASNHFKKSEKPIVVKANGLALGKGVYVCRSPDEAEVAIDEIMVQRVHGDAGDYVIIEDFVSGQEVSIHAFCDGRSFSCFPSAQDHKPIFDGDKGPNTGGMGTIAPVPWFTSSKTAETNVVSKILKAMKDRGTPFSGLLYPGIKVTDEGLIVLEFNARFGDPETQVYMRLLKSDLLEIFEACVDGRLHKVKVEWYPGFAVCVAMTSAGYPSPNYQKGLPITGIDEAEKLIPITVFHAGTKYEKESLVTSGGRVLYVTSIGASLGEAIDLAYQGVRCIHFKGAHYRKDIGHNSLLVH